MELDIAFLANVTGDNNTALRFTEASGARKKAMNSIFWNAEMGQWVDYWLNSSNTSKVKYLCTILEHYLFYLLSFRLVWYFMFLICRMLIHGKLQTKMQTYLPQILSHCGSIHSIQVSDNIFSLIYFTKIHQIKY